jgi:hypothetical protein
LKLAERATTLKRKGATDPTEDNETQVETAQPDAQEKKYQTLNARAAERQENARAELLELLSIGAEQIGDLNRAAELETTRIAFLIKTADKQTAQLRLDRLREMQRKVERERKPPLVIDQKLVTVL